MGQEFEIQNSSIIERIKHTEFKILTKGDFEKCPFKEHIIDNDKIMFVILVGSSTSGIYDDYSDIDICRVMDIKPEDTPTKKKYYGHGNNIHVHITSRAYEWKYPNFCDSRTIQELSFGLGPGELKDEYCLYLNPKYKKEYEELKKGMKQWQYYAAIHVIAALKGLYEPKGFIPCKFGLQCLYAKAIINREEINKNYLLSLKRSRYRDVPQQYLERLEKDKEGLRNYGKNLTEETIEKLWTNISKQLTENIKEL